MSTLTAEQKQVIAAAKPGSVVRLDNVKPLSGGGYVADDGRTTPAARKTLAAQRLAKIASNRPPESIVVERTYNGETWRLLRWDWPTQVIVSRELPRDARGFIAVETAANWGEMARVFLTFGVVDENGDPAFDDDDVRAYCRQAPELVGFLFNELDALNPDVLPKKTNADTST